MERERDGEKESENGREGREREREREDAALSSSLYNSVPWEVERGEIEKERGN